MLGNLLIVNSHCPNARYVPMGSFGLCDHLVRQGHQARIFNGSNYPVEEQIRRLEAEVARFQPTVIGLIMQWKEYTESAIRLSRQLKRLFPETPLIAGGITAGYFADPLLRRYHSIDGVIRGDAEEPLHQVLCGTNWAEIPNLLFRKNGEVVNGRGSYLADSTTLNRTSFAGLDLMVDHQRYLEAIEPVLGFPVFIGRGCLYRCQYCGGSRKAFAEHSGRKHPVFRSTESVVRDLRQLSRYIRTVYIGFENSARYLKKLFRLVAADPELAGTLTLNYGAWDLPDRELLELYGQAFRTGGPRKPILEISPETAIDDDRRLVRDPSLYFSNRQLTGTLETIRELFGNDLRVELYYSRYHHTHESREKLETELCGIHDLHEHLHHRGFKDVIVTNYHLATDMGSDNWDRLLDATGDDGLDTLLRGLRQMRSPGPDRPALDNLCLYAPPSLDRRTLAAHDRLVSWLELLRKQPGHCYFIAARVLGFRCLVRCLQSVIEKRRCAGWGEAVTFPGLIYLLRALAREVEEQRHEVPPERQELVQDLARLHAGHVAVLSEAEEANGGVVIHRPVLDEEKLCFTGWNMAGGEFLRRLEASDELPPGEPTLNVYGGRRIFSFPRMLESCFRLFDGTRTVEEVLQGIGADGSLDSGELRELLVFFTQFHTAFTG